MERVQEELSSTATMEMRVPWIPVTPYRVVFISPAMSPVMMEIAAQPMISASRVDALESPSITAERTVRSLQTVMTTINAR